MTLLKPVLLSIPLIRSFNISLASVDGWRLPDTAEGIFLNDLSGLHLANLPLHLLHLLGEHLVFILQVPNVVSHLLRVLF